jgi:RNA polymerase sigma-70 factor (ECF subfamily)
LADKANFTCDEDLMQRSSTGDRLAFEALYDRYFSRLVWFARQYLKDRQKAEDVVQDVFIRIIQKPEAFDPARKFSTWVYTVTANACKNILRDELRRAELLQQQGAGRPVHEEPEPGYDTAFYKKKMAALITTFTEKEKIIFSLRFEQELPVKEIAQIAGIPEGSVKSGIFYLLKKIGQRFKDNQNGK